MSNSKELRDGVVEDGGWTVRDIRVCEKARAFPTHESRGILICKIFLLRKCQSGGGLGQLHLAPQTAAQP